MFSYTSAEQQVPKDHPLRAIRAMVDAALRRMGPQFDAMYAKVGRPSIAPEKLLRALLLTNPAPAENRRQTPSLTQTDRGINLSKPIQAFDHPDTAMECVATARRRACPPRGE